VFHAQVAQDAGAFDIDTVARGIVDKLVRRHPHVFGDVQVAGADEVKRNWDRIKREDEGRADPLAGIPAALPALHLATKLQQRAADGGFVWPSAAAAAAKVTEELEEVLAADGAEERDREVGDLLLAVVSLARDLSIDAEGALRRATRRFRERYTRAHAAAVAAGREPTELSPQEWAAFWQQAKREA
jgi:MazG family protein